MLQAMERDAENLFAPPAAFFSPPREIPSTSRFIGIRS